MVKKPPLRCAVDVLDGASLSEVEAIFAPGKSARKDVLMIVDLFPNCIGEIEIAVAAAGRVEVRELDQFVGILSREHAKDDGVDEAEDGGVGADAERESEDGGGGEGWSFAEGAEGVANVLEERFEEGDAASVATFFLGAFEAAEFATGATEGFVARDAVAD